MVGQVAEKGVSPGGRQSESTSSRLSHALTPPAAGRLAFVATGLALAGSMATLALAIANRGTIRSLDAAEAGAASYIPKSEFDPDRLEAAWAAAAPGGAAHRAS